MRVNAATTRHPDPRTPLPTTVPPTPAEQAAASAIWERKGPLGRLVRR